MKTETEIQNVIDSLSKEDADDPCDDLPYIENVRAFKEALLWVLEPCAILTSAMHSDGEICAVCGRKKGTSPLGSCPNFCT